MDNKICTALANAAHFRAEQGDNERAEQLLRKSIQLALWGDSTSDRFFSWVHLAHFLIDNGRDAEAELAFRAAIESVPLMDFNLRHAIAINELGELIMRLGRPEEGLALQVIALKVFDTLADDVALNAVESISRAS
jgi:hypothetical protein